MVEHIISSVRVDGCDTCHHWSQESQKYATAATLLIYMRKGWQLAPQVAVKSFSYFGGRHINVYYFTLTKDGDQIEMPVLLNPVVRRLITHHHLHVVRMGSPDSVQSKPDIHPLVTETAEV